MFVQRLHGTDFREGELAMSYVNSNEASYMLGLSTDSLLNSLRRRDYIYQLLKPKSVNGRFLFSVANIKRLESFVSRNAVTLRFLATRSGLSVQAVRKQLKRERSFLWKRKRWYIKPVTVKECRTTKRGKLNG